MKIYKQETDKSCGVACIRSALNYYGNNFSEKDIWDKNASFISKKEGLLNPIISLGVTALKFGFNVKYIGYHPTIANNNLYPKNLKKSLQIKSKDYFENGKFIVDSALEFLKLGGELNIEKLNVTKIQNLIDKYKFAVINTKPAFYRKNVSLQMNHKVIINGYDKKGFKILNPSDTKEYLWDDDTFLLTFYAAVPELLIIYPKK
jgi:hypothetical protein